MPAHRLDPRHPDAIVFSTKLGVADAARVGQKMHRTGLRKSAVVRLLLLEALDRAERADSGPPDEKAA